MAKKVYTLDDLVQFCSVNNFEKFDAAEKGQPLLVRVPASFSQNESENSSTMYATVKLLHTGRNRNGSNVTESAAKKCLDGIKYKPLLANFCEIEDENGESIKDFTSHDMILNEDGTVDYLERQIGCFTADKPYIEKEDDGRSFIYATVAIPREYSSAAEIIERKGGTKVSAELLVNKMSYDINSKELMLEDIEVMGCTCLGTNPNTGEEVQEGMRGARLDIESFSADSNILDMMQKLTDAFEAYTNLTRKEETEVDPNKEENFDEVTELEEVTEETTEDEVTTEEDFSEDATDVTPEEDVTEEFTEDETDEVEESEGESADCLEFSVTINGEVKTFSVSLNQKMEAMFNLVNETYSEQDNDIYDVEVYEDDHRVEMHGWFTGKSFRQEFKCKKDKYTLHGDRTAIFVRYLSEDEIAKLESIKSNYSSIESELADAKETISKYEAEPEKMEILNADAYAQVAELEEFVALKERDAHFDMSIDEVTAKADAILLEAAKAGKVEFSAQPEKKEVGRKSLFSIDKANGRYGDIFSK